MTMWEFPCSEPATIRINPWASGSIAVSGEPTGTLTVEVVASHPGPDTDQLIAAVQVTFADGRLEIAGPRDSGRLASFWRRKGLDLTIKAPAESDCQVHAASADISCVGSLGELDLHSASGDITVAAASGRVSAQSASGDVLINEAAADVAVRSTSGDVQVSRAGGSVNASTVSGDFAIGGCGGPLIAHTVSGEIQARDLSAGRVDLTTVSGDVYASVTPGIGVYLDLASTSGDVRSELDEDPGGGAGAQQQAALELRCRTISGDVRVARGALGTAFQHPASA